MCFSLMTVARRNDSFTCFLPHNILPTPIMTNYNYFIQEQL